MCGRYRRCRGRIYCRCYCKNSRGRAGQARARAQGRTLGRPPAEEDYKLIKHVTALHAEGASIRSIATTLKRSPTTIHKLVRAAA
jgi:DNA invertase Pin-like site-specific DNA recombinase